MTTEWVMGLVGIGAAVFALSAVIHVMRAVARLYLEIEKLESRIDSHIRDEVSHGRRRLG